MDIFNILSLVGGLALFLFGMQVMGEALEKRAGNQLKNILEKLTSSRFKGFLLGAGVTAIIQSSSATTVMVVGFVNSGIMNLKQAIGIIMGANVGTTITSWILSLSGIESSNVLVSLLKPTSFTPVLALIGIILLMRKKNSKSADTGMILLGFAVLMFGMDAMSAAVSPLRDVPEFQQILTMFSNPILGVLAGAFLTAVIQSSSASVGILQALASTGAVSYGSAIPIIMGQNIGTCVTAMISAVGANKNAKRTAVVHLAFNIIGTTVWLTVFCIVNAVIDFSFINESASLLGIAVIHTIFNVLCTALLFPFAKLLEKIACFIVRDSKVGDSKEILDERLMATPAIALEQCRKLVYRMLEKAESGVRKSCAMIQEFSEKELEDVVFSEQEVDKYEDELGTYLVQIGRQNLSEQDSHVVSELLHIVGDIERISDHSVGIVKSAEKIERKNLKFSDKATEEIQVMIEAVEDILEKAKIAFRENDTDMALSVEAMEHVIDHLKHELKKRHIDRLKNGKCSIEQGFIMTDIITSLERISDHCSNVAGCVEEIGRGSLGIHAYTREIVKEPDSEFDKKYQEYRKRYELS
ncbi:MAG: Na/Pi cotransporter family protein [Eubacterium sp.]|nr:Na/Pi cotransporter family protein [Eubacterium sp.]